LRFCGHDAGTRGQMRARAPWASRASPATQKLKS